MQNFQDLSISAPLLQAIQSLGYTSPSPIQAETLPILLGDETDFLGLAATGTGKTAAFSIPLLEKIDVNASGVQALILCPTRELAIQVAGQIDLLGKFKGLKALPIYGGTGYGDQIYGLKAGAKIVVGTPGRVVDHMEKGTLKLDEVKTLVLDEADEMISMGFKDDLELVLGSIRDAKTWLFSATMGSEVRRVADTYLKNPRKVQVNRTEMVPDTVQQIYYMIHEYDKPALLCKLIDVADDFYGIIFCQTKSLVVDLTQFLIGKGYRVDCLHGDMDQTSREKTMRSFRERKISILVATDVACRGLDVKDISHVINYSIPRELDNYVHRIGRTGRSGKSGLAFSLVTNSHRPLLRRIEQMTKTRLTEGHIPTMKDIALKKTRKARALFEEVGPQGRMTELLGEDWQASIQELTKEEIVGRFITLLHPELALSAPPRKEARAKAAVTVKAPAIAVASAPELLAEVPAPAKVEAKAEIVALEQDETAEAPAMPEKRSDRKREKNIESRPTGFSKLPSPRAEAKPFRKDFSERRERSFSKPGFAPRSDRRDRPSRPDFGARGDFGARPSYGSRRESSIPQPLDTPVKTERRYQGRPGFEKKKAEMRLPPWERGKSNAPRSTPWGAKTAGGQAPWKAKKKFSAPVEGKAKRWDSRPTKPSR